MDNKLIFEDVEELVSHMFDKVEVDESVTAVVNKDVVVEIMNEFLTYEDVVLEECNIELGYNREYFIVLDQGDNYWSIGVYPAYDYENNKYYGMDGYVLFHEDINSKALVDMQNNSLFHMSSHDWFVIGEDDSFENDDDEEDTTDEETCVAENENKSVKPATSSKYIYRVNDKEVNKETYDKISSELDLLLYDAFKDIINEFRPRRLRFFW